MQLTKKSFLSLFLSFTLLFSLLSTMLVKPVDAKSVRVAVIASLSGDVTIKKGGGSKTYEAYEKMSLNQGDTLYTGSDSSVTLNLSSGDADVTIGDHAELNVSDLITSNGSKKSKLKIWAGSMWVKVKSLAGSDDEFEVETPTAVMGVRGTQFFVGVDPKTGKIKMAVGSGKVSATTVTNNDDGIQTAKITYLYPTQQISLDSRDEVEDSTLKVDFIDLEAFIKDASPEVIKAIIENKAEIDKENDEFIAQKKKELEEGKDTSDQTSLFVINLAALDKVKQNLDNLVGNIAKKAIEDNKITKSDMEKIIEDANKKITDTERKLDLDKVKELDKTAGIDPEWEKKRQEELKKLEAEKLKHQEEEAKQLEEIKRQLEASLKAAEEAAKKIEEANKMAEAEAQEKAEEELKKTLSDAEKQQYDDAKNSTTTTPTNSTSGDGDSDRDTTPPVIDSIHEVYANQNFIYGKTEPKAVVTVKRDGIKIAEGTAFDTGYFYAYLLTGVSLNKGQALSVTATDDAGNTSAAVAKVVMDIPDTTPPVIDSVHEVYVNQNYVYGKTEPKAVVTVMRDNIKIAEGIATDDGYFYAYILTGITPLIEGQTLSVTATDTAGNTSAVVTKIVRGITVNLPTVKLVALDEPNELGEFTVGINLKDFKSPNDIYAVEVHLVYSGDVKAITTDSSNEVATSHSSDPAGNVFDLNDTPAAESARVFTDTTTKVNELVYAISSFGSAFNTEVVGEKELVRLPFKLVNDRIGLISIPTGSIIIVKKDLTVIEYQISNGQISFGTIN